MKSEIQGLTTRRECACHLKIRPEEDSIHDTASLPKRKGRNWNVDGPWILLHQGKSSCV